MLGRPDGIDALEAEVAELQRRLDRGWEATLRGANLWRKGHPERELILPDHAKHVEWLLDQTQQVAELKRLRAVEAAAKRVDELLIHCAEDEDAGEHYELYNVGSVSALRAALERTAQDDG